jgi:hypothetical protein
MASITGAVSMKTIIPMQRVGEPVCATGDRPRRGIVRWALTGFGFGVVAASAYLLLGGEYFLSIPRWADIVFYPGFLSGNAAYKWRLSLEACKVVGVLAVGFAYAALAVLARFAWFAFKYRRRASAVRPSSQ